MCWSFSSTQASLVPNGGSSVLVLSACAKAVCRVYVRISLPTIVQLASRPRTTGLCCASSIWAELTDVARFAALEAFVQWAHRKGVVSGSRAHEGTLPADRGASAAAAPAASVATRPPRLGGTARSWGRSAPGRRWCALPHHHKSLPCKR